MNRGKYIFFLLGTQVCFACVKPEIERPVSIVPGPIPYVDYRDKFAGTYVGPNTDWQSVQGITTTWVADSNLADVYTKDPYQDSVMLSKYFGTFTVSANGKAEKLEWKAYRSLVFRGDSVYYTHSDWSALGGSYGNYYKAKKKKN